MDYTFCEVVCFIDGKAEGDGVGVVPGDFVFADGGFGGLAAVFGAGCCGVRWEGPFYVGGASDEGDVVEVYYLRGMAINNWVRWMGRERGEVL